MDFSRQSEPGSGDLGTPKHDELMIALMSKDKWKQLITKYDLSRDFDGATTLDDKVTTMEIEAEVPVIQGACSARPYIIGYIDIVVKLGWSHLTRVNCEIKATEKSLGSVIRQIKRYEAYNNEGKCRWVVVSPWEEWEEPLKSQGITWISASEVLAK